jgi:hypothetical protein
VTNLETQTGAHIWEVLYLITVEQSDHLDRTEGVPRGAYRRIPLRAIVDGSEQMAAFTHIQTGSPSGINATLDPPSLCPATSKSIGVGLFRCPYAARSKLASVSASGLRRSSDVANGVDNIAARGHHRRYQTAAPTYQYRHHHGLDHNQTWHSKCEP